MSRIPYSLSICIPTLALKAAMLIQRIEHKNKIGFFRYCFIKRFIDFCDEITFWIEQDICSDFEQ